ncbi:MAG: CgeB family protein [Trichloromonadaceae bacterium]
MRVLVVGKRGGILHWFENVVDAFSSMPEVESRAFCVNHFGYFDQFWKNIVKKCSRDFLGKIIANQFAKQMQEFNPDLILIVDYFYIPEQLMEILAGQKKSSIVVWWIGDLFDRQLVSRHGCVDKFYFTDSYFIDYAAEAGLHNTGFLPLGYNPKIFRKANFGTRKSTLAFVGAYSENRANLLKQVKHQVLVVGKKWDRLGTTHHEVQSRRVEIGQVAEIYNQHIGVLNIKNSGNVVNGLNMRTFDAPACGCVVINDYLEDLEKCFDVGNEILVYNSVEELNDQFSRLKNDSILQKKIVEAGLRRVKSEHQYRHRLESILKTTFN